jgi:hypothetical protein
MDKVKAVIKRTSQPAIADYRISAQILQGAIKRGQVQPLFNRQKQIARENYDIEQLKEMSKPYLLKDLRNAWKNDVYSITIYKKPLNKLKKVEVYHELLNANHNFANIPKRVVRRRA